MAQAPISIKLRCASWQQLASIYKRDLARSAIFLKSANPPALGTPVKIDLTLPSESMVVLSGVIAKHIGEGEMEGRGPGVDVRLSAIPQSAMWLIETALASAQGKEAKEAGKRAAAQAQKANRETSHVASLTDGSDLAAAETELLVALTSELDSLKRLNAFQVLGLGYEATDADVRAAFGELTKRYHPDRYARFQSTDLRNLAAEIFILIRDAYRRLFDEASRGKVLSELGTRAVAPPRQFPRAPTPPVVPDRTPPPAVRIPPPSPPPPPPTGPTVSARVAPSAAPLAEGRTPDSAMAESMLDGGKYDEALAFFKILVKKNPGDRQAKAGIELAEGMRALAARDRLEAAQRFEAVLELDPANERAARELAEMRRVATNERKGMLSRLLGKKE